jgi:predicted MFS family arabinose efflux permease
MLAFIGVSGVLGSLAAPRIARRLTFRQVMVAALGLKAVLIPFLVVMPNAYALGALFGAMFFIDATWGSVVGARQLSLIPDRLQGRVNGAVQMVSLGTVPIGAVVTGALFEAFGGTSTILAFGAVMVATALAAIASRTIATGEPAPPEPPRAPSPDAPPQPY